MDRQVRHPQQADVRAPHRGPPRRPRRAQRHPHLIPDHLLELARVTRGFLPEDEALALHQAGLEGATVGPLLEVGTYCGKSALFLGAAAAESGTVLFTVDHHRGSEENQPGWEHHDRSVVDPGTGRIDTLPHFRRTMEEAGLEDIVIAVVGQSSTVAAHWQTPLGLVFIDGGHGEGTAHADYDGWARHVALGGLLAIHDVFPDPSGGGRPPFEIYCRALAGGDFAGVEWAEVGSLRVLQRVRGRA